MNTKEMIEEVCLQYKTGQASIFSQSRQKAAVTARKIIYKVLMLDGKSSTQIGNMMNRDHSTIVVGARSVDEDMGLKKYATYLYLKYRNGKEVNSHIDVSLAKSVITDEIKHLLNEGLSKQDISIQLDLSEKMVSGFIDKIKKDCEVRQIPNYHTGTYKTIYI